MFRTELRDRKTHWVAAQLLRAVREAELRIGPLAWVHPWAWATKSQHQAWRDLSQRYGEELGRRYQGLIAQQLYRSGNKTEAPVVTGHVLQWFIGNLYTLEEADLFSRLLWSSVVNAGIGWSPEMKRRFMLRQFVEDVPKGKSRNLLKWLAFERTDDAPPATAADLAIIRGTYSSLHRAMMKRGARLEMMTAGAIAIESLRALVPPYAEYEQWLFKS